ncbi:MAG: carboxylesterase/lipase family protein [Acidimicrobiales bacterium]
MSALIETSTGTIRGGRNGDAYVFKAIPYAQAPIGELRFSPPVPTQPWAGIREATQFSTVAMQNASSVDRMLGSKAPEMSEDCLTLNVWTPGLDDTKRPVMVWIHGGSFLSGSGRAPWYDGMAFATLGDVIIVTINYRLGPLGFLYLADLDNVGEKFDGELASSGNVGLLDQVAALQWVQDNIANFGGNPDNVTIFGESAGAMSIGALLACPSAKGLFHQVIMQSGAADNVISTDEARRVTHQLLDELGLSKEANVIAKLRSLPVDVLLEAQANVRMQHLQTGMPWRPVVDESVILTAPIDAIDEGVAKKIRVLIGTNLDEARFFTVFDPNTNQLTDDTLIERCDKRWDSGAGASLLESYRTDRPELSAPHLWAAIETDRIFRLPALDLVKSHIYHQSAVYTYLFTWPTPAFGGSLGSCHVLEIPFAFNNLRQPGVKAFCGSITPEMENLASNLHDAWTAFAHSGDPNHSGIPAWPTYNATEQPSMVFDETCMLANDPGGKNHELLAEIIKASS